MAEYRRASISSYKGMRGWAAGHAGHAERVTVRTVWTTTDHLSHREKKTNKFKTSYFVAKCLQSQRTSHEPISESETCIM